MDIGFALGSCHLNGSFFLLDRDIMGSYIRIVNSEKGTPMTTPTITRHLSEDDRAAIADAVADWTFVAGWTAPGYTDDQNRREAYHKILRDLQAGYTVDMAVDNLNDDRETLKIMHERAVYDEGLHVEGLQRRYAGSR